MYRLEKKQKKNKTTATVFFCSIRFVSFFRGSFFLSEKNVNRTDREHLEQQQRSVENPATQPNLAIYNCCVFFVLYRRLGFVTYGPFEKYSTPSMMTVPLIVMAPCNISRKKLIGTQLFSPFLLILLFSNILRFFFHTSIYMLMAYGRNVFFFISLLFSVVTVTKAQNRFLILVQNYYYN